MYWVVEGGKEGQDAMSLHDMETILHLTALSLPDLQDSTSLHDTASSLRNTDKEPPHCSTVFS